MDHYNKRPLYHDENMPPAKKFKVDESETPSGYQIAIIVPIMAGRFKYTIDTYKSWSRNGFDVVLVFNKDEEEAIFSLLQQHAPDMMTSFQLHSYTTTTPPNAGMAKMRHTAFCYSIWINHNSNLLCYWMTQSTTSSTHIQGYPSCPIQPNFTTQ